MLKDNSEQPVPSGLSIDEEIEVTLHRLATGGHKRVAPEVYKRHVEYLQGQLEAAWEIIDEYTTTIGGSEDVAMNEYENDIAPLVALLDERKIPYRYAADHRMDLMLPELKLHELPTLALAHNKSHIFIGDYSVIRGYVSLGAYEVMYIGEGENPFSEPEQFDTADELLDAIQSVKP